MEKYHLNLLFLYVKVGKRKRTALELFLPNFIGISRDLQGLLPTDIATVNVSKNFALLFALIYKVCRKGTKIRWELPAYEPFLLEISPCSHF